MLALEVTEGVLVDRMADTIDRMAQLAALGLRFSIDEFGTGYASLAHLRQMPLYEQKIDGSSSSIRPRMQAAWRWCRPSWPWPATWG